MREKVVGAGGKGPRWYVFTVLWIYIAVWWKFTLIFGIFDCVESDMALTYEQVSSSHRNQIVVNNWLTFVTESA